MKKFEEILSEKEAAPALGNGQNTQTLTVVLLCQCWFLYCNVPLCMWLEESERINFVKVNASLKQTCQDAGVQECISDVMSMIDLAGPK
jgi:MFS-type transporter involved in bile tolerance (Atg22 family)